ncbi:hypothetical protein A3L12_01310 [Thermococcus sp. P6]|uniref:WD40 repeat domain-containing protein n=1 Tax=Thermococcus sp. P6 TaxID=122420 RepID=UPI000B59920E|nr:PQQ-binding-like beta-propeller repeat protein [Thermococcus sp. P6]ASJ10033.1 hypothetical protein A3L12_01310 [Thermococcus sp. P6]
MRKKFILIIAFLLIIMFPDVSAQPRWDWTYKDQCIVFSMAFNDNGDLALGFGYDAILFKPNGTRVFKSPVRDFPYSIALSDNDYTVVGTKGFFVHLFDPRGNLIYEYKTDGIVWAVDISKDGERFIAGSEDGNVYFFEGKELKWKYKLKAPVWSAELYGGYVIAGDDGGNLVLLNDEGTLLWEKELRGRVWRVKAKAGRVMVLALWEENGNWRSRVYAFSLKGEELWERDFDDYVRDMDFDGNRTVVAGDIGEIVVLDSYGEELYSIPSFDVMWDVGIGRGYVLAGGGSQAFFIDPQGNVDWVFETNETIEKVSISENGRYLAVSHKVFSKILCEGTVHFMDMQKESTTVTDQTSVAQREGTEKSYILGGLILVLTAMLLLAIREMRE